MLELKKIHEDNRGEMYVIPLENDKEIKILTTKEGYARGGCYHEKNDEFFMVIQGTVNFLIGGRWATYPEGSSGLVPKGLPHMMIAETDCLTIEWGATKAETETRHEGYRKYVESLNRGNQMSHEKEGEKKT